MKTEDAYVIFEKLLDEEKVYLNPAMDFNRLCQMIDIDSKDLNNLLLVEHGLDGEEIINIYREAECRRLYNIISGLNTKEPRSS